MRHLLSALFLAALAASATGCVVSSGGSTSNPDVTLDVTFAGAGCQQAGVGSVRLSFVNPQVGAAQTFPCDLSPMTIVVPKLAPNTYTVQLEGLDVVDPSFVAFASQFQIVVTSGGTHEFALDLLQSTEVVTDFTFAGYQQQDGMNCDQAGITTLNILVDDAVHFDNVACHAGSRDAASLTGIDAGTHKLVVDAFDAHGSKLYSSTFPGVQVNPGSNEFTLNLLPTAKAGLEFSWDFGPQHLNCASAGVSTIQYSLVDASGAEVFSDTIACAQAPVSFRHDNPNSQLDAGLYALATIKGRAANGQQLFSANSVALYAPAGRTQGFVVNLGF